MTNIEIVNSFIQAINDHNADNIYNLLSEDHVFVDGYGNNHVGKNGMKEAWQQYYRMFPDYKVEITDVTENVSVIGLFGYASATYKNIKDEQNSNFWKTTAAWKAIVEDKKIKYWQVFCDYSRLKEIIDKN
jgi:ketosteroid isomerase-like protein